MKTFTNTGYIKIVNVDKSNIHDQINNTIKHLHKLYLNLNNGKLNKEQKRCLTSLYNQLIKSMKDE